MRALVSQAVQCAGFFFFPPEKQGYSSTYATHATHANHAITLHQPAQLTIYICIYMYIYIYIYVCICIYIIYNMHIYICNI